MGTLHLLVERKYVTDDLLDDFVLITLDNLLYLLVSSYAKIKVYKYTKVRSWQKNKLKILHNYTSQK